MLARCLLVVLVGAALSCSASAQTRLRIATWNIAWLSEVPTQGNIWRGRADFARLAMYARRLDADIIALQEINTAEVAARVFPREQYEIIIADQHVEQRVAFAIRRSDRFTVQRNPDYRELNVPATPRDPHDVRYGVDITVNVGARALRMLAVHLKSSCSDRPLTSRADPCIRLFRQIPVLEAWIDARAREGVPFVVLGDFNRRFGPADGFWMEIDDGNPPNVDLTTMSIAPRACWRGDPLRVPIDHIVFDRLSAPWRDQQSDFFMVYDEQHRRHARRLSDHCAIRVTLEIPS